MTSQETFRSALLDPDLPVPDGLADGANNPGGRRFSVYRNNVTVAFIDALSTAFPLVRKLLGARSFDNLAPLYVRAHPPQSPLMMHYGADFPAFLEAFQPLSHVPYLGDAARLDLALRASYHAADAPTLAAEALQQIEVTELLHRQITLAPSTRVLQSRWPLFDIWRFNQDDGAPKPRSVAQDVLITRPTFDPQPHPLPPGGAYWLQQMAGGAPFGEAHDRTLGRFADFDLAAALTLTLAASAFSTIKDKDLT